MQFKGYSKAYNFNKGEISKTERKKLGNQYIHRYVVGWRRWTRYIKDKEFCEIFLRTIMLCIFKQTEFSGLGNSQEKPTSKSFRSLNEVVGTEKGKGSCTRRILVTTAPKLKRLQQGKYRKLER